MAKAILKMSINISNMSRHFINKYKENFHYKKWSSYIYYLLVIVGFAGALLLNIKFMSGNKFSYSQIFYVLTNWSKDQHWVNPSEEINGLDLTEWQLIQTGWYNVSATILAGIGMTLAAVATQSLTKNAMAEGSTLGLVQAGIFGVLLSLSMGMTGLLPKYLWTILLASIGSILLILFIVFSKRNGSTAQKIILAGLAIGIIFKTISFIIKSGDQNLKVVSFAYVLGGAESISSESLVLGHDKIPKTLFIAAILELLAIIFAVMNIKGMNLLEIGDERAKNLGSSVMLTRVLNVIVVLLALPAAVILVGNMAFLGLFAVHSGRWLMKSRNYRKVLPTSLIVGMLLASIGLQLSQHMPQINSGIWMTFIGAPYLMYIGIRGLK